MAPGTAKTSSVTSLIVIICIVLIDASNRAKISRFVTIIRSVLNNATVVSIIVQILVIEVTRLVYILNSIFVDVGGAIAILVTPATDSTDFFVLLSVVILFAIATEGTKAFKTAYGASISFTKSKPGADRATVASETTMTTSKGETLMPTAKSVTTAVAAAIATIS